MKTLETGEEKIQKICDLLRKETIEPAQKESEQIIANAKKRATEIVQEAQQQAEKILQEVQVEISQQRNVFQSSLEQAAKQSKESLRQSIEHQLFNNEISRLVTENTTNPNVIADLIKGLIKAIDKDGLAVDLSVFIPSHVSVKEVNQLLGEKLLSKLREGSVALGDFKGGVRVRMENKKITLDISDTEIAELLSRYARKDFRKLLFA